MMQRSDLVLVLAAGFLGTVGAYLWLDWLGAATILGALAVGLTLGHVLSKGAPPRPVRKVRGRAARASPAAAGPRSAVTFVAARPARAAPAMEPAQAALDTHTSSLRLTGDILRGMQTGGKVTRGKCSQCGSLLWLSARRPLQAKCPVCGHSRLLTR